jgi:hypothetical protein
MQMQARPCFNDLYLCRTGHRGDRGRSTLRPCPPFLLLRHQERYRSKAADTFDAMISAACSDE